jgi:hypothetical protein
MPVTIEPKTVPKKTFEPLPTHQRHVPFWKRE